MTSKRLNVSEVVLKMSHEISKEYVLLKRNPRKEGNALKQLEDAINEVLNEMP